MSDHVCRLVTGDEIDKRRLYSDTEQVVLSYRRTGAITAVSLPPLRSDALERVIPLPVNRIPEQQRRSEAVISREFVAAHPVVLGALCDALVGVLDRLPSVQAENTPRPRMADYHDVLRAYDPAAAEAYRQAAVSVMVEAAEADPFVATISAWLKETALPWTGTATEAYQLASAYRTGWNTTGWWPASAASFGGAIARAAEPLRAVGIHFESRRANGARFIVLSKP